jgi:NTP pyrophosphatase (non-canonical NTP hydrolase)
MTICTTLRDANITRQKEWDTGGDMTLSYSGNEFAGEVGEAIEAIVLGQGQDSISDELGDVVICCDLLAMRYDQKLDLPTPGNPDFAPAVDRLLLDMAIDAGRVCNTVKKLERESFGMKGSRSSPQDMRHYLLSVLISAGDLAQHHGLILAECAADKFNKTSEKVGLKTRYVPNP